MCPRIFASGARTAGPIGTGKYWFDYLERRKDDGASCGPIGCTWQVPRAIFQKVAKIHRNTLQAWLVDGFGSNLVGRLPPCGECPFGGGDGWGPYDLAVCALLSPNYHQGGDGGAPFTCVEARDTWFHFFAFCAGRGGPIGLVRHRLTLTDDGKITL